MVTSLLGFGTAELFEDFECFTEVEQANLTVSCLVLLDGNFAVALGELFLE